MDKMSQEEVKARFLALECQTEMLIGAIDALATSAEELSRATIAFREAVWIKEKGSDLQDFSPYRPSHAFRGKNPFGNCRKTKKAERKHHEKINKESR